MQDGALLGAQFFDQGVDFEAHLRVEAGGGLVEKEQRRVVDQTQRDGEALLLAAGERGVEGVALVPELQALQQIVRIQHAAVERAEEVQGFDDLDLVGQIGGLQADADAVFELLLLLVGIEVEDADVAGGALADAFEDFDSGGFAGAVGTEQSEDFAGVRTSKSMPLTASKSP